MTHFKHAVRTETIASIIANEDKANVDAWAAWIDANKSAEIAWWEMEQQGYTEEQLCQMWDVSSSAVYRAVYSITMK